MSGVEVAGIVLGVIPVIVTALQNYAAGVSTIKTLRKYERELGSLIRQLKVQTEILRNTCEELLNGIDPASIVDTMLDNPGGTAWEDSEIDQQLKARLQGAYDPYMATLEDMKEAVEEIRSRLRIDKIGKEPVNQPSVFRRFYHKFEFSLCRKSYEDLLNRIKDGNHALHRLTSQNLRLEPARSRRIERIPDFQSIRTCANGLLSAVQSGFGCNCKAAHRVNLLLEKRGDNDSRRAPWDPEPQGPMFSVIFAYSGPGSDGDAKPWSWRASEIQVIEPKKEAMALLPMKPTSKGKGPVRFAEPGGGRERSRTRTPKPEAMSPILDLCGTLATCWPPQCSQPFQGYLTARNTSQKLLLRPKALEKQNLRAVSLRQVLAGPRVDGSSPPLRGADAKRLAIIFASTLLQLYETPWIAQPWRTDDVVFLRSSEQEQYMAPYISVPISAVMDHTPAEREASASREIRAGCPNIRNEFIFALGILLIELCMGSPIEKLRKPMDLVAGETHPILADFRTATRILDDVYAEAGERYERAVRKCIYCDFDQRKTTLEDPGFRRAVYEGVVCLLEEDMRESRNL